MSNLFIKLNSTDIKKEKELSQIESEYNLKIPDEFKYFYSNFIVRDMFNSEGNITLAYGSERISNYYTSNILISHFCKNFEMRIWFERFQMLDFFNNEGLQIAITEGSTFILLIANAGSPNYGKVLYYDLEMATDEVFILGDRFNEFLSYLSVIQL